MADRTPQSGGVGSLPEHVFCDGLDVGVACCVGCHYEWDDDLAPQRHAIDMTLADGLFAHVCCSVAGELEKQGATYD